MYSLLSHLSQKYPEIKDFVIKSLKGNFLPEDLFKVENEEILKQNF